MGDRTWVNGRGRDVIMVDMRRRIDRGEFELEVRDNIEVCRIYSTNIDRIDTSANRGLGYV